MDLVISGKFTTESKLPCQYVTVKWVIPLERGVTACWHVCRHESWAAPLATMHAPSNSTCHPPTHRLVHLNSIPLQTHHQHLTQCLVQLNLYIWFSHSYRPPNFWVFYKIFQACFSGIFLQLYNCL